VVQVERADRMQRAGLDGQLLDQDRVDLDQADHQGDRDRQPGDHDVVVDLAHRSGEGPAVGEVHEHAVDGVQQAHPGGEKHGQHEDGVPGHLDGGAAGRQHQQADLRSGVEAQAEQEAHGVHVPGLAHRLHDWTQDPVHQPAVVQLLLQRLLVELAAAHRRPDPQDAHERDQVDHAERDQEQPRDAGAEHPGELLQRRVLVRHLAGQRLDADRQQQAQPEDDAGVSEGEPEADTQRPLVLGDQLAGGVVDGRDVVRVEGVPHPQHIRRHAERDAVELSVAEPQVLRRDRAEQHPPADHVQQHDEARHAGEDQPLGAAQRLPEPPEGGRLILRGGSLGDRHETETIQGLRLIATGSR
jgi:hypothetical protein